MGEFRWYVAEVTSELRAMEELRALDVEVFRPIERELGRDPVTKRLCAVERRLFPGYLFVRLDLSGGDWEDRAGPVNAARGVAHLLPGWEAKPVPVAPRMVEAFLAKDIERSSLTLDEFVKRSRCKIVMEEGTEGEIAGGLLDGKRGVLLERWAGGAELWLDVEGKKVRIAADRFKAA